MKYIDDKTAVYVKVRNNQNAKRYQTGIIVGTQSDRGIVSAELDSGADVDVPEGYVCVLQGEEGIENG